jgi:F0F1-type ATP synthase delta subunit
MNKQIIKQLVSDSYTEGELDAGKVFKIADILRQSELKEYIHALKEFEKKTTVMVTIPAQEMPDEMFNSIQQLFPKKKIMLDYDPNLILGVKVTDNDRVYEFTLRNTLEKMVQYVEQNYD